MQRTRRRFLNDSLSCAGYLAASLGCGAASRAFAALPQGRVVAETDFARVEQLGNGIWAIVSTPLKNGGRHFQTVSNGGIVAGDHGVAVIEGFMSTEGAAWVHEMARRLSGQSPTHLVVTHFHADHCRGLPGLQEPNPGLQAFATRTTQELMRQGDEPAVPDGAIGETMSIDLGGRTLTVVSRRGHTPSDVTIHLDEPEIIWCGDLVWNAMFPNFTHAIPSHLTRHCEEILGRPGATYVPGHGDVAEAAGLDTYLGLLRDVEAAARRAFEAGRPAAEAAAEYVVPASLGEWFRFSEDYYVRAFAAWERELRQSP